MLLGVTPFGMIFGALAASSGMPPLAVQAFSIFIFAGSAQFIALQILQDGAPALMVVLTILLVNMRHLLYSASVASGYARLPLRWKIPLAWLLTDEAYAMIHRRYRLGDLSHAHWYALATGMTLWACWQASTALGILLGAGLPASLELEFALPLTFLAILIPTLTDRPAGAAALSAGLASLLMIGLPFRLGLLAAAGLGILTGLAVESRGPRQTEADPHGYG
jgi:4-azaleucine resistance transporter AzlC